MGCTFLRFLLRSLHFVGPVFRGTAILAHCLECKRGRAETFFSPARFARKKREKTIDKDRKLWKTIGHLQESMDTPAKPRWVFPSSEVEHLSVDACQKSQQRSTGKSNERQGGQWWAMVGYRNLGVKTLVNSGNPTVYHSLWMFIIFFSREGQLRLHCQWTIWCLLHLEVS